MDGMRFHDSFQAPMVKAFGKEDLTVARAGIREEYCSRSRREKRYD